MKKIITTAALCFSAAAILTSCKGGGASEVGKWEVTNIKMSSVTDTAMQSKMTAMLADEHMIMEFNADGTMKQSGKTMPAGEGKYTRSGDKLIATDSKTNKTDTMTIVSNDGKEMTLSGNANGETTTMTMKKQN